MSTPPVGKPLVWAAYKLEMISVALKPEFSAKVRATTSKASAYFLMAYLIKYQSGEL
jgi:hypothetical protein